MNKNTNQKEVWFCIGMCKVESYKVWQRSFRPGVSSTAVTCVGRLCSTWAADVVWLVSAGCVSCMCAVGTTVRPAALVALLIILVIWMSRACNLYMDKTSFGKDYVSQWIWLIQDVLSNTEFLKSHSGYLPGASQSLGLISLPLKPGPQITLVSIKAVIGIPFCFHQKSYCLYTWE